MRLSCFEPIIVDDVLNEDIQILWERYKKIRVILKNVPEKIKSLGRNYVDTTLADITSHLSTTFNIIESDIEDNIVMEVRSLQKKHLLYLEV